MSSEETPRGLIQGLLLNSEVNKSAVNQRSQRRRSSRLLSPKEFHKESKSSDADPVSTTGGRSDVSHASPSRRGRRSDVSHASPSRKGRSDLGTATGSGRRRGDIDPISNSRSRRSDASPQQTSPRTRSFTAGRHSPSNTRSHSTPKQSTAEVSARIAARNRFNRSKGLQSATKRLQAKEQAVNDPTPRGLIQGFLHDADPETPAVHRVDSPPTESFILPGIYNDEVVSTHKNRPISPLVDTEVTISSANHSRTRRKRKRQGLSYEEFFSGIEKRMKTVGPRIEEEVAAELENDPDESTLEERAETEVILSSSPEMSAKPLSRIHLQPGTNIPSFQVSDAEDDQSVSGDESVDGNVKAPDEDNDAAIDDEVDDDQVEEAVDFPDQRKDADINDEVDDGEVGAAVESHDEDNDADIEDEVDNGKVEAVESQDEDNDADIEDEIDDAQVEEAVALPDEDNDADIEDEVDDAQEEAVELHEENNKAHMDTEIVDGQVGEAVELPDEEVDEEMDEDVGKLEGIHRESIARHLIEEADSIHSQDELQRATTEHFIEKDDERNSGDDSGDERMETEVPDQDEPINKEPEDGRTFGQEAQEMVIKSSQPSNLESGGFTADDEEETETDNFRKLQTPHILPKARKTPILTERKQRQSVQMSKSVPAVSKTTKKRSPRKMKSQPPLPTSLTKSIFTHFSSARVSKEAIAAVEKGSEQFFKRLTSDLGAYCQHSHHQTIEMSDIELLMKRQKLITSKQSLESLIEQHLPLEYRRELIPVAYAGNLVKPKL